MAIIVPIVSKFDSRGLKEAQSGFSKIGSSLKGILGAAGIGVGIGAVVSTLKESASAAVDDVKSQALLANQLKNTVGATDSQVASVEASIKAMQMQAAVADDDIRPAFAALVRATGDVNKATYLTSLALDVAAGTGKDLGSVSLALGKAVNGSTTSLLKLVPSIKGASNPMGELSKQFSGAAEAAANNDPIQRLTVVMGELQEQLGMYLLPALQDFAGFLADASTQENLSWFINEIGSSITDVTDAATGFATLGSNVNDFFNSISGNIGKTPFTDFLTYLIDLLQKTINPLGKIQDILSLFGVKVPGQSAATKPGTKISKGLTPAEKTMLGNSLVVPAPKVDPKVKAAQDAADKAAAALKARRIAAAQKTAAAQKVIADAAQKAADTARKAFDDLKTSIDDFNTSFADTAKGFNAVFKFSAPLGEFEQQATDAFDAIKQSAKDAFDNKLITQGALDSLTKYADQEKTLLVGIAKERDVLAKKISIAQAVTNSIMGSLDINSMLQSETKQVTKSITSMVNGIALTTTQTFDEVVTSGLADSFKKLVQRTQAFATNLKALKALGLNGQLFKQIVDAGAETGGATAEAIIAGGADAVKELNGLFGELTAAGASIAETATPIMYDLGDNMTNSFIDGLRSQDQMLIDTANSMALLFTSQFKIALDSAILPTLNASMTATGLGMDNTDYIRGIGRVTAGGQTPTGGAITINVNAGVVANKQELPQIIVDALGTYTKQSGAGGLTRVLGL